MIKGWQKFKQSVWVLHVLRICYLHSRQVQLPRLMTLCKLLSFAHGLRSPKIFLHLKYAIHQNITGICYLLCVNKIWYWDAWSSLSTLSMTLCHLNYIAHNFRSSYVWNICYPLQQAHCIYLGYYEGVN